ncbi:MAG: hypothetical protein ACRDVC_01865 [Acidimicrobiales bacterium]
MPAPVDVRALRRQVFGASILILVQSGLGMYVNLFVTIPSDHSGAHPGNYVTGSLRSLLWSVDHGAIALAIHAVLGVLLAVMVIGIVARSLRFPRRSIALWSVVAALLVIGAGFNGASFLDFNKNASSFIMALLAFGALASYLCMFSLLHDSGRGGKNWRAS